MRVSRYVVTGCILGALLLAGLVFLPSAEGASPWPIDQGELCWRIEGEGDIVRLLIIRVGPRNYMLTGRLFEPPGNPPDVETIFGNAEVDGDAIYITLCSSGSDASGMWGWTTRAVLDGKTLNGPVEGVGIIHESGPGGSYASHWGPDTLALV